MSFESGSTALTICSLSSKPPKDMLERLAANSAGKLDDVKSEPVVGWVSGRHLLESEIDETTAICGGHLYVNLRTAERKIPSSLLKAICRREELAYMQANDMGSVPGKERRRIKAEAVERNLPKMPPSIAAIPAVLDMALNVLYVGSGSLKQLDLFIASFLKALDVEPVPMGVNELMFRLLKADENDLPPLSFSGSSGKDGEACPGRDFLTWLWFHSEENGGKLKLDKYGEFQIGVDGPLTFAFSSSEAKGAAESAVKKGCPQLSAEAKAALAVGKKLKKAKLLLARDSEVWSGTFDADKFSFSGLNLPEGEEMERNSRFAERVDHLHVFHAAFEGYFKAFAESVMGDGRPSLEKRIRKWAQERESY